MDAVDELADHATRRVAVSERTPGQDRAMREDIGGKIRDILRHDVVAAVEIGFGFGGGRQRQRAARRGGMLHLSSGLMSRTVARSGDEAHDVVLDGRRQEGGHRRLARRGDFKRGDRRDAGNRFARGLVLDKVEDLPLDNSVRQTHLDLQHETIELRFRQREGPLVLDRVLRRDDHEGLGQGVRDARGGHLMLGHRLEQSGLHLRRRTVDLVDEHK